VNQIASKVVESRQAVLRERMGSNPLHITSDIGDLLPKKPVTSEVVPSEPAAVRVVILPAKKA
jgi:hypothetical protein